MYLNQVHSTTQDVRRYLNLFNNKNGAFDNMLLSLSCFNKGEIIKQ